MLCCTLLTRRGDWAVQAHKLALRALRALNLKPISPSTPESSMPGSAVAATPAQSTPEVKSPSFFSPWAFPPTNLAKVCALTSSCCGVSGVPTQS